MLAFSFPLMTVFRPVDAPLSLSSVLAAVAANVRPLAPAPSEMCGATELLAAKDEVIASQGKEVLSLSEQLDAATKPADPIKDVKGVAK